MPNLVMGRRLPRRARWVEAGMVALLISPALPVLAQAPGTLLYTIPENRALAEVEVEQLYRVIQTTPPASSFESWVLSHGLSGVDAGKTEDPDRDRLSNWEEYSFGTSPTDETASLSKAIFAGSMLTLEWFETAGVRYSLKESATLAAPWTAASQTPVVAANQNGVPAGYIRMQVSIPVSPSELPAATRYFRDEAAQVP
jgi:hypothetical protein